MPRSDPIEGWLTPLGSELPDGAAAFASLADQVVKQVNLRFATTTERDAAIASGARRAGMRAWIDALGYWTTVLTDGGAWVREGIRETFTGTEGISVGATPPAGTLVVRKFITAVASTNAAGGCAINFPSAFTNGVVTYTVTPGDNASNFAFATTILANCGLGGWNGIAYQPGGSPVTSGFVRINVLGIGW